MASASPSTLVKQIINLVEVLLRQIALAEVSEKARKAVLDLRQSLNEARIYSNDYELSEMREEQIDNAKKANKWLDQAHRQLLRASEFDVFGPIDVAHLTAQIDQVKADLK